MDENGLWLDNQNAILLVVSGEFAGGQKRSPFAIQEAIPLTTDIVASDNTLLTRDAAEVEVYQVVFQLSPSKALGLNGRHAIFFQKF